MRLLQQTLSISTALALLVCSLSFGQSGLDTAGIEQWTGAKGKLSEKERVFKVSVPRSDLRVTAAGVTMTPPMGLTSWASFKRAGDHTLVMGDMVLLEDQVSAVMDAALDNDLEVTALHNHFFWESPRVVFMHIAGMGDQERLAKAVGKVFATIRTAGNAGARTFSKTDSSAPVLDPARIDAVLGAPGEMNAGVYKVTIGRVALMHGQEMGSAMGVNTWAAFSGSNEKAVVDGDFAMLEHEVQRVLKTLRKAGIDIVAIHNHMTGESPRFVFLHYWGVGSTIELARGLKSALETQNDRGGLR
ncbi:MAG: DUF1259 domain-containing protein [Acidobacteriota bacterium]